MKLDISAASGRRDASGEGQRACAEVDALHFDVVAVLDVRDIHPASRIARHLRLDPGFPSDGLCLGL
jgi:hypothetical protein